MPETAGVSPNGDNSLDAFYLQIGLLRNVDNIHYTVTNLTTGEVLSEQDTEFLQKSYAGGVYAGQRGRRLRHELVLRQGRGRGRRGIY